MGEISAVFIGVGGGIAIFGCGEVFLGINDKGFRWMPSVVKFVLGIVMIGVGLLLKYFGV